jgi:hypothetical protein
MTATGMSAKWVGIILFATKYVKTLLKQRKTTQKDLSTIREGENR